MSSSSLARQTFLGFLLCKIEQESDPTFLDFLTEFTYFVNRSMWPSLSAYPPLKNM